MTRQLHGQWNCLALLAKSIKPIIKKVWTSLNTLKGQTNLFKWSQDNSGPKEQILREISVYVLPPQRQLYVFLSDVGDRKANWIEKRPWAGTRTRDARSTTVLHVSTMLTMLLAPLWHIINVYEESGCETQASPSILWDSNAIYQFFWSLKKKQLFTEIH